MAPEILNKKEYTFPVDTWALGILLFKSLNGSFPFRGNLAINKINNDYIKIG